MKLFHKRWWRYVGQYMMYYADYLLSTAFNLGKLLGVGIALFILLPIPPILWKVHRLLYTLVEGKSVQDAIMESKFAHAPLYYEETDDD